MFLKRHLKHALENAGLWGWGDTEESGGTGQADGWTAPERQEGKDLSVREAWLAQDGRPGPLGEELGPRLQF